MSDSKSEKTVGSYVDSFLKWTKKSWDEFTLPEEIDPVSSKANRSLLVSMLLMFMLIGFWSMKKSWGMVIFSLIVLGYIYKVITSLGKKSS